MSKCLECGYYDKEKHYCPFYCQLIRETLNEAISFELEKIKDEIQDYEIMSVNGNSPENVFYIARDLTISVINSHISELRGGTNVRNN